MACTMLLYNKMIPLDGILHANSGLWLWQGVKATIEDELGHEIAYFKHAVFWNHMIHAQNM